MLKNYFKIAARELWKNKVFSGVNITVLVLGIACCLVIALHTYNELHHGTFHINFNNIYRIVSKQHQGGTFYDFAVTPRPLADEIPNDFPEIENINRVGQWSGLPNHNTTVSKEKNNEVTENSFCSLFDFILLSGDANTALASSDDIVFNESVTEEFFGAAWRQNSSLTGQLFTLDDVQNFKLTGVLANPVKSLRTE